MNIHLVGALTGLISAFRYKAEEYNACLPQQIKTYGKWYRNSKYNAFFVDISCFITFYLLNLQIINIKRNRYEPQIRNRPHKMTQRSKR